MKFHSLELLRRARQDPLRERILQFAISVAAGTLAQWNEHHQATYDKTMTDNEGKQAMQLREKPARLCLDDRYVARELHADLIVIGLSGLDGADPTITGETASQVIR